MKFVILVDQLTTGISLHGPYNTELEADEGLKNKGFKEFLNGQWAARDGVRASVLPLCAAF